MKILIIDCLAIGDGKRKFSRDFIGGGPRLIAGVLHQIGKENFNIIIKRAETILFKADDNSDYLEKFDICLISAMSMDLVGVKKIIKIWRDVNHNKTIIIGGPIASDEYLLDKIRADILVKGEGEKKIVAIMNLLVHGNLKLNEDIDDKLKHIKGIIYRGFNKIIHTKSSIRLNHSDYNDYSQLDLSIPYIRHYTNFESMRIYVECLRGCSNYNRTFLPLTNKGKCLQSCNICNEGDLSNKLKCPSKIPPGCGFCSTINSFGYPKSRKIKNIIAEIRELLKLGARRIVLGGPDFLDYEREGLVKNKILTTPLIPPNPNYNAIEALINEIINFKTIKEGRAQIFIENIKASLCTSQALEILSKIPNCIFSIGCETGSEEFARILGRPFSPSKTLTAIKTAIQFGIRIHIYFIHSLPGDKVQYIKDSIDLINTFYKLGVEKITIYKYQEFPGAPFFSLKNKHKFLAYKNKELNRYRKKLVRLAINFNKSRKEEMLGKSFKVLLSELDFSNKFHSIGYIIRGGPKVLIKNSSKFLGKEVQVKIIRVLSDKLVEGEIIRV